jgi:hypothetical protein
MYFYSNFTVLCIGARGKPDRKPYPFHYVLRNPYRKTSSLELSRLCPETSTKLYVNEFGFRSQSPRCYPPPPPAHNGVNMKKHPEDEDNVYVVFK